MAEVNTGRYGQHWDLNLVRQIRIITSLTITLPTQQLAYIMVCPCIVYKSGPAFHIYIYFIIVHNSTLPRMCDELEINWYGSVER